MARAGNVSAARDALGARLPVTVAPDRTCVLDASARWFVYAASVALGAEAVTDEAQELLLGSPENEGVADALDESRQQWGSAAHPARSYLQGRRGGL